MLKHKGPACMRHIKEAGWVAFSAQELQCMKGDTRLPQPRTEHSGSKQLVTGRNFIKSC